MGKNSRKQERRRKKGGPAAKAIKWAILIAVVGFGVYGLSQLSGVAYTERDIGVVSFEGLTASEKQAALEEANSARCTCACGMTLAQCVSTDMSCPVREDNVKKITAMVRAADKP